MENILSLIFKVSIIIMLVLGFIDFLIIQSFFSGKQWYQTFKKYWGKILIILSIMALVSIVICLFLTLYLK
jgi:hypothetical protein